MLKFGHGRAVADYFLGLAKNKILLYGLIFKKILIIVWVNDQSYSHETSNIEH